jgi:hypothetical protein
MQKTRAVECVAHLQIKQKNHPASHDHRHLHQSFLALLQPMKLDQRRPPPQPKQTMVLTEHAGNVYILERHSIYYWTDGNARRFQV